eukprot:10508234-Heterocapsa_arctica.AAC.1
MPRHGGHDAIGIKRRSPAYSFFTCSVPQLPAASNTLKYVLFGVTGPSERPLASAIRCTTKR